MLFKIQFYLDWITQTHQILEECDYAYVLILLDRRQQVAYYIIRSSHLPVCPYVLCFYGECTMYTGTIDFSSVIHTLQSIDIILNPHA